ncbi:MAG: hypothetical protein NVSMB14_00450 [Isosphaeraceae bacterium]
MRRPLAWALALSATLGTGKSGFAQVEEPNKPTAAASEKTPNVPAAGHSVHGEAFNDGPRRKAVMLEAMGKVDFSVTTGKAEARGFVNQGVAQLHSFYYLEAERSFRQAALIDPDCALAYWGMAMANVYNEKRAKGFLSEANKRAGKVQISRRERLYLDALGSFYRDGVDVKGRRQGLLNGLETIVQEFPADLDAKAWLAMVTWQNSAQDGIGSRQAVDSLLEDVGRIEPMHPGIHHYRIHLWDGVKPERALKSAGLFAKSALGIAHAWHMPGHTYTGLKRYSDAAYQQEGSARVDHAYMMRDRVLPFEIHNYAHNNQWLVTTYSHLGKIHDAIAVARNLVEQPRDPNKNGPNDGGSSQRSGRLRWVEILTKYELWDDLIEATNSGALDWTEVPLEKKERHLSLGRAYAAKGDKTKLAEQVAALRTLPKPDPKPQAQVGQGAIAELEGYQKLLDGDVGAAFDLFAKANEMRPEALARAHVKARNFGFAESVAKRASEGAPNQVEPEANYVEILEIVGKTKEAQEEYRKLVDLAREADLDAPIFQRLSKIVARWQSQGWKPPEASKPTDETVAARIDLTKLGPLVWSPMPAEPFAKEDTTGKTWSLADHRGRNVVVLFFLGGKCAHCMQQLGLFGKEVDTLKKLDADLVAIGTDDLAKTKSLKNNASGIAFPMPLLADPSLDIFKSYQSFDDFENQPLHGTFLIDAQGKVRWSRVSADPFLDIDFIKGELARVNRLVRGS